MKTIITICCMAAVLSAKDHIAAATKHITLAHAEYSIYFIMGWEMSIKLPLPIGDPGIETPPNTRFLFNHPSTHPKHPKLYLDWFSRFSTANGCVQKTHRQHTQTTLHLQL